MHFEGRGMGGKGGWLEWWKERGGEGGLSCAQGGAGLREVILAKRNRQDPRGSGNAWVRNEMK